MSTGRAAEAVITPSSTEQHAQELALCWVRRAYTQPQMSCVTCHASSSHCLLRLVMHSSQLLCAAVAPRIMQWACACTLRCCTPRRHPHYVNARKICVASHGRNRDPATFGVHAPVRHAADSMPSRSAVATRPQPATQRTDASRRHMQLPRASAARPHAVVLVPRHHAQLNEHET